MVRTFFLFALVFTRLQVHGTHHAMGALRTRSGGLFLRPQSSFTLSLLQIDFSDLYDILAFFRGDLSGAGARDDLAERIATAGKMWSREFYRQEDMTAYQFRWVCTEACQSCGLADFNHFKAYFWSMHGS